MSDEQRPFDDLLRSPFDPIPGRTSEPGRWLSWQLIAAIAIGALAVVGGYAIASSEGTAASTSTTTTTSATTTTAPTTTTAAAVGPVDFPPGFVAVNEAVGIKPEYIIDAGDQLIVSFTSVARRGFEIPAGFQGGDWVLQTAAGDELTAAGIAESPVVPGSFSVQFPKNGEVIPERLYLVSKWELDSRDASVELPFTGTPFEAADVLVDLGGGASLVVDRISLGDNSGQVLWSLEGAGGHGGVLSGLFVTIGPESAPAAYYLQFDGGFDPFGGFDSSDVATGGTVNLERQGDAGANDDTVSLHAVVNLIGTVPADVVFDLTDTPGLQH